ncbi:uncharacterized protein LOC131981023 [Centropristis striata]|uniref:uncharacterized protein LOC131981023 n=1 Tax=Centropristis striata TaxID=184440 RepID=UPI0027DF310E|nr:uncharacterized protein LOC131981023 [Centropristis striata]
MEFSAAQRTEAESVNCVKNTDTETLSVHVRVISAPSAQKCSMNILRNSSAAFLFRCVKKIPESESRDVLGETETERTRRDSDMLFLLMGLLCWSQSEGGCSETVVSISGDDRQLSAGDGFNLSCEFTCLRAHHIAQLWWRSPQEEKVSLVNMSSVLPDVVLVLRVSSATKTHTGYYSCRTQPPDTISPDVLIQITDDPSTPALTTPTLATPTLTTPTLTTPSPPQCVSSSQQSTAAGLQGQMWIWVLLGKTLVLLLSLICLSVNYNRG